MAQLRAFWAEVVRGGCSGLKKYMSALPSSLIISSFAPNKVTPFFRKNLAASLVPVLQCLICLIHCHLWWPSRREQHKDAPYSSIIYIYPNQHMDLISYLYNTWICLNSKLLAHEHRHMYWCGTIHNTFKVFKLAAFAHNLAKLACSDSGVLYTAFPRLLDLTFG
jgi:hypothetical protein